MTCNQQSGYLLASAMVFLFILISICMNFYEDIFLQSRMNRLLKEKIVSFEAAEWGLLREEGRLQHRWVEVPDFEAKLTTSHRLINVNSCGKKRYRIDSQAEYRKTRVFLRSIYEQLRNPTEACLSEKTDRRVVWKQLI